MKKLLIILIPLIIASCGDDTRSRKLNSSTNANPLTNSQCSYDYNPVCGQPPMPVCPPGIFCAMVMPAPTTYDNECVMKEAGASLISTAACQ